VDRIQTVFHDVPPPTSVTAASVTCYAKVWPASSTRQVALQARTGASFVKIDGCLCR
jgi:hypothetical protein